MSIYVGNLPYSVSPEDLRETFEEYGKVVKVHIPKDRETERSRGFGFVEMQSEEDEQKAIETLNGAEWLGRQLTVNKAKPRPNSGDRPSRGDSRSNRDSFRDGGVSQNY